MSSLENYQARVVTTGTGPDGRSTVVSDGPTTTRAVTPTFTVADVWRVDAVPPRVDAENPLDGGVELEPPRSGVLVRMVSFPPDSEWQAGGGYEDAMASIGGAGSHDADAEVAGMHATDSVDVVTVVEGELHAVLETGEVLLRPGDSLVQRGTKHAWSNRTDRPATIVATMVGAHRGTGGTE
ncbi:cupin domain-containing protein [Pseudonocardia sp. C8]|uniref:cupin domain-containing protein n=1 Tax=Pseudonocardia sp. C8 TaxID=2762759 RepID=UPI00164324FB|nr:cupin domain-containing protein [Pseudonocardia sp. C8]MBC3191857.1 cupin domain-containing protein [Pseudonocardia sp. C8]